MKKVLRKRRKECKTDYLKRLKLLKSGKARLVFRKTNKYIIVQYVESKNAQDKIVLGFCSKELLKYGWPKEASKSIKNITASYLIGFLIGKKIINNKLDTPIIDFGMIKTQYKTKIYAFLKGLIDSGLKIKYKEETFPEEERIKGKHLKNKIELEEIKSKIEKEK